MGSLGGVCGVDIGFEDTKHGILCVRTAELLSTSGCFLQQQLLVVFLVHSLSFG
jgi:hypothetical protein